MSDVRLMVVVRMLLKDSSIQRSGKEIKSGRWERLCCQEAGNQCNVKEDVVVCVAKSVAKVAKGVAGFLY